MTLKLTRKISKGFQGLPNLLEGYPLAVNRKKFRLIDAVFRDIAPESVSFADLGGVWRVEAAYTIYTLKTFSTQSAFLVDTNISPLLDQRLRQYPHLRVLKGDFGAPEISDTIGSVDVLFLFDVLLHQVKPDWNDILGRYARQARVIVIYNQQYISGTESIRLTDLSLSEYTALVPRRRDKLYEYIYDHGSEIHPEYGKPWKDIHNIWQWGITDHGLRSAMADLGYQERLYRNYGTFSDLRSFEDHGFVFVRQG
jgi:hypothetical protein